MNEKISDLDAIAGVDLDAADLLVVLDVSDPTMAPTGTDKNLTYSELLGAVGDAVTIDGSQITGTVADARIASTIARDSEVAAAVDAEASARDTAIATAVGNLDGGSIQTGTVADARIAATIARDTEVTAAVSAEASARDTAIANAISALVNNAPLALDTLLEIANQLATDESAVTALTATVAGKVAKSAYDAQTILAAVSDDTPVALTVSEQTLIGRVTGGNIAALSASQIKTLLSLANVDNTADTAKVIAGDVTGTLGASTLVGTANVESIIRANSLDQMAPPAANVSWNSKRLINLDDAAAATDAMNRQSADARFARLANNLSDLASAKTARSSTGLNIEAMRSIADANATATATDRVIAYTSISATRTVTLPAANAVNPGTPLLVCDFSGSCGTGLNIITVARAGTDTLGGGTAQALYAAYVAATFVSDGVSAWSMTSLTAIPWTIGQGGTGQATAAAAFKALAPLTTRGDIIIENSTPAPTRLAIGAANTVLRSNGVDPAWAALVGASQQLVPTGAIAQTVPRISGGTNTSFLVSAQMLLAAIWLPADTLISTITFVSGTTALSVGVNQWFALYNSARGKLAVTNDDTSTAWSANAAKTLTISGGFTTTYEGLHYLACMVKATTPPSLVGQTATVATKDIAPILGGLSTAALTNPASAPTTAAAITVGQTAVAYAYVS